MNSALVYRYILVMIISLAVVGCGTIKTTRTAKFKQTTFKEVTGWEEDSHSEALASFRRSCDKILSLDAESSVSRATSLGGSSIDWQVPCMEAVRLESVSDMQAKQFFEKWFTPYQVFNEDWSPVGTLTGYFQIELEGSKKKTAKYKYPIYRRPDNLQQLKGSDAIQHAAINNGALAGQGLEVAYVDNRARLYMMHIQGSGVVKLKEGGHLNLGFEDHNGYRFTGISRALRDRDMKFDSTLGMMDFLHRNPKVCHEILAEDPSYVFFKPIDGSHTVGGHGVELRPERSLAVDYELYPYGMPLWVAANLPEKSIFKGREYRRLFIAQDTGGAIRGAVRGDVFFGRGSSAERVAQNFKVKGRFYALFPKTAVVPETFTSR